MTTVAHITCENIPGLLSDFCHGCEKICVEGLGSRLGLSHSKGLLFEGKNHGPKDRAELQEYIGEPLARNTVDAFNDGRKY